MATDGPDVAFVWVWLPGAAEPVPCGRLDQQGELVTFAYGQRYLERPDAIALYLPELPLERGVQAPELTSMPGCISDAGPDAWGRRLLEHRHGRELAPLAYLLESGSSRIGALDFQASPTEYRPRTGGAVALDDLLRATELVEAGAPLPPDLDAALLHGTSVGGARPKATVEDGDRALIAKFARSTDTRPVVQAEFVAMTLAARAGLDVAPVEYRRVQGRHVLLVERFDRPGGGRRRLMVSARTILRLGELGVGASYADLANEIRARFTDPAATVRELFARIAFSILIGNTDDHARNHAAFWDGEVLTLTPAYDLCPQERSGGEASQAMAIGADGYRLSQVAGCVERAATYLLSPAEARDIVEQQIAAIEEGWAEACDAAALTTEERAGLWGRQFLNPFALDGR